MSSRSARSRLLFRERRGDADVADLSRELVKSRPRQNSVELSPLARHSDTRLVQTARSAIADSVYADRAINQTGSVQRLPERHQQQTDLDLGLAARRPRYDVEVR